VTVSVEYYELGDRVIEARVDPDTPGVCRRTLTLTVVSGPPLSLEEYRRVSAAVVADQLGQGCVVHPWAAPGLEE
jgi:hypothetical protein